MGRGGERRRRKVGEEEGRFGSKREGGGSEKGQ